MVVIRKQMMETGRLSVRLVCLNHMTRLSTRKDIIKCVWGDPDVDGRIILRWIFRKWEGVVGTGWSWLEIGTGGWHL